MECWISWLNKAFLKTCLVKSCTCLHSNQIFWSKPIIRSYYKVPRTTQTRNINYFFCNDYNGDASVDTDISEKYLRGHITKFNQHWINNGKYTINSPSDIYFHVHYTCRKPPRKFIILVHNFMLLIYFQHCFQGFKKMTTSGFRMPEIPSLMKKV